MFDSPISLLGEKLHMCISPSIQIGLFVSHSGNNVKQKMASFCLFYNNVQPTVDQLALQMMVSELAHQIESHRRKMRICTEISMPLSGSVTEASA